MNGIIPNKDFSLQVTFSKKCNQLSDPFFRSKHDTFAVNTRRSGIEHGADPVIMRTILSNFEIFGRFRTIHNI